MRKSKKGITLLELTLALGILAIVSVGITLGITSINRRALANASLQLQADIYYAQRRAIMEGVRYRVIFEAVDGRYRIRNVATGEDVRTVYLPQRVIVHTNLPHNQVDFLPRGTASDAGRITLLDRRYQQNLTINVSGGRVAIQDMTRSSR